MKRNQTSIRDNIEDFLCPFTDMYITQGSNSNFSHKGIMANDVRGKTQGIRYPYYAPCKLKCLKIYKESGQSMWQSLNKVRFANGRIDYATLMVAHDDTLNCYVGQIINQGDQLGNMGTKGNSTGVHCHIEISQSADTTWTKNSFGNWHFNNEYDLDDCYFIDQTNILNGHGGNWKKTTDVKVNEKKLYITLYNMNVREDKTTTSKIKKVKDLTPDGKLNATSKNPSDDAVYKKSTVFTALEIIKNSDNSVWAKSPSGYICISDKDNIYCKEK